MKLGLQRWLQVVDWHRQVAVGQERLHLQVGQQPQAGGL